MNTIITKKVRLIPAPVPFVGTKIRIRVDDSLDYKINSLALAEGHTEIVIDWGDGERETNVGAVFGLSHRYPSAGEYTIRISDDILQITLGSNVTDSEYNTRYNPMILSLTSNAANFKKFNGWALRNAVNMSELDLPNLEVLHLGTCAGCVSLAGELFFPSVNSLFGSGVGQPFAGCSSITRIHFAEANEAAITATATYNADKTLGTGVEDVCVFDL